MPARIVLVAGPGGAGSSTVAAALAAGAAAKGRSVGLIDLDPVAGASSLLLPDAPTPEILDTRARPDGPGALLARELTDLAGLDGRLVDELVTVPGAELLSALVVGHEHSDRAELIVVDAGSRAVDLCGLAHQLPWVLERLLPAQRGWLATSRPLLAATLGRRWPGERASARVRAAYAIAGEIQQELSAAVAVTTQVRDDDPRSLRTDVGLALHGIPVCATVTRADDSFSVEPVLDLVMEDRPVSAAPLVADGTGWIWRTPLPSLRSRDVAVRRLDDDLVIEAAGVRRVAPLPSSLRRCHARSAVVREGTLEVRFTPDQQEHRP
ncbi:ArsA family ATPase [Luteipulveratus mongoliensis]|uniref:Uncharacterized protein n=1 Tax=Luteipulveratus mongoliensis TaxID=571913 RepID=A0A0K1JKB2_9MICO|nr:hypothetical protein [Luteipulveratus mongoliensis]AKU17141.1 hypothetical protein VV02_16905 [Luteipulveratus mongoliensis]